MNQMELKTHECLQFFLPRIAVALEDIAKELSKLKKPNENRKRTQTKRNLSGQKRRHKMFVKIEDPL